MPTVVHVSWLRSGANGDITSIDPSGAIGSWTTGVDDKGTVVGYYMDCSWVTHGFERSADGTITVFDPKNSTFTIANAIDDKGMIAGYYISSKDGKYYGFLLSSGR